MARHSRRSVARLTLASLAAFALVSGPAQATFHFARIVEICLGTAAHPDAQYIVIMPYATLQSQFSTVDVTVWGPTGTQLSNFATFSNNLNCPIGCSTNQRSILVATTAAQSIYSIRADQAASVLGSLPASGVICFEKGITAPDCVSYGNYTGPTDVDGPGGRPDAGPPALALPSGEALHRSLGADGLLDAADDTDDSSVDFSLGGCKPQNFAQQGTPDLTVSPTGGVTLDWTATAANYEVYKTSDPQTVRNSVALTPSPGNALTWVDPDPDQFPVLSCYLVKPRIL